MSEISRAEISRARTAAALLIAFGLPLAALLVLRSRLSVLWVFLPVAATAGPRILHELNGRKNRLLALFSALSVAVFAVLLLAAILITPYSAYRMWAYSVQQGTPSGAVSNIFVLAGTFFASLFSPALLTMGPPRALLLLVLVILYLLSVIFTSPVFFGLMILLIAASLLILDARGREPGSSGRSLPFLVLGVSLAGGLLLAGDRQPRGSSLVDYVLYPELRRLILSVSPEFPLIFEIPGYGYSIDEKQLGGRPMLSDRPVFEVEGRPGETLYLRTRVFDHYDGRSWSIAVPEFDINLYRSNWLLFSRRNRAAPDLSLTLTVDYYSTLPHTLDTVHFDIPDRRRRSWQGNTATGYLLQPPLERGDTLRLARGEEKILYADERGWDYDPRELSPERREYYLQVPDDLPADVRRLARRFAAGDPDEVLRAIQSYLASNYVYSLTPREPRNAPDFVQGFLFGEGAGYCVHFASSFIILARLNGLPARYATGFLVYIPPSGGSTPVTGLAAHAWPEVWLEDRGWVSWEATSAVSPEFYTRDADSLIYNFDITMDRLTLRQIEGLLGHSVADTPLAVAAAANPAAPAEVSPAGRPASGLLPRTLARILPALLAPGLLLLVLRFPPIALLPGRERRLRARLRRLVHHARHRGLPGPETSGWAAWFAELSRRAPALSGEISGLERELLLWAYGPSQTRDPAVLPHLDGRVRVLGRRVRALGRRRLPGVLQPRGRR